MPSSASCWTWDSSRRSARMPACTFGCSVLTRPSRHSGKPVSSSTLVTGMPSPSISAAEPPVDTSATPASCRPRDELLEPGLVVDRDQRPRDRDAVAVCGQSEADLPVLDGEALARHPADGVDQQRALGDLDPLVQRLGGVVVLDRDRGLRHDRAGVDAVVDEEQRAAGDLDAVRQRVGRRRACRGTPGSSAGCVLTNRPPNAARKSAPTSFMKPAETTRSGSVLGDRRR